MVLLLTEHEVVYRKVKQGIEVVCSMETLGNQFLEWIGSSQKAILLLMVCVRCSCVLCFQIYLLLENIDLFVRK